MQIEGEQLFRRTSCAAPRQLKIVPLPADRDRPFGRLSPPWRSASENLLPLGARLARHGSTSPSRPARSRPPPRSGTFEVEEPSSAAGSVFLHLAWPPRRGVHELGEKGSERRRDARRGPRRRRGRRTDRARSPPCARRRRRAGRARGVELRGRHPFAHHASELGLRATQALDENLTRGRGERLALRRPRSGSGGGRPRTDGRRAGDGRIRGSSAGEAGRGRPRGDARARRCRGPRGPRGAARGRWPARPPARLPSSSPSRRDISAAALSVKVMATVPSATRAAIAGSRTAGPPVRARRSSSSAAATAQPGPSSQVARRATSARVLPVPAPASSATGRTNSWTARSRAS